jgi:hypothetical protein
VAHYGSGGPYTFQAILNADGSIVYQYLSMGSPDNSATVGIQNASGTDALQMAYNTGYIHNDLAVRIAAVPQWMTVSPTSGTVWAPGSTILDVNYDTAGLLGGTYDGNIRVMSNDPDEPEYTVPVTLTVIGAPDIDVAPPSFDFGEVFLGATPSTIIQVQNPGTDMLHVSNIAIDDAAYVPDMTAFDVPPRSSQAVVVTFTPTAVALYPATMTVTSDDPDEPTVDVALSGEGVEPPDFSVDPTSLVSDLLTGESETQALTLYNGGGADLEFTIGVEMEAEVITYADVDLAKGEEDPGPGVLGAGGPDAFGYSWIDSDEPGGPAFNWFDISGIGTALPMTSADQNSGPVAMGFSFPFYGNTFSTVNVCTNGWMSFTSTRTNWSNRALPTGGTTYPENLIAPFWDDLHFRGVQRAHYYNDGSRFIVQWTDVDRYSTGSNLTFQVILYPSGRIVYQYLSVTGFLTSNTIGIQNETRDVGLTVAHNTTYVHDGLAILIAAAPEWLTASPLAGTIPPGGNQVIDVAFNATDLFGGLYEGSIDIATNDPLAPEVSVPAVLTVTGAPDITVNPTVVDFGEVFLGYPKLVEVSIVNEGTDLLTVTDLVSDNSDFLGSYPGGTLPINLDPMNSALILARFAPTTTGLQTATLSILSNDADTPSADVSLSGVGLVAPVASVNPDSLHSDLLTGEVEVQQFMIYNTGGSDLDWEAKLQFAVASAVYTLAVPEPSATTPDVETGLADPVPGRTTPIQAELADLTGVNIMWDRSHGQTTTSSWTTIISDFESRGATVTVNTDPITPALLLGYNVFWSVDTGSSASWDPAELTALVSWINGGGGVLLEGDNSNSVAMYNDLLTAAAAGITFSTTSGSSGTTTNIYAHPTTENVTAVYLTANIASIPSTVAPGGPLFDDDEGVGAGAYSQVGAGRIVAVADEVFQSSRMDDDDNQLFGNQVMDWLSTAAFLSVDPMAGTIPPGGDATVDVTFDATGMFGGDYAGMVRVLSNDPASGVLDVQATLHVTGVPRIGFDPAALDFGDVFIGYPEALTLTVANVGTDFLTVSSVTPGLADYSVSPAPPYDLDPLTSMDLTVTFDPQTDGDRGTMLTFMSNDPDSPHMVALAGVGVIPPVVSLSPDPHLGAAPAGGLKMKTIPLCNTGGSDLIFDVSDAESPTAVEVHSELDLPKGTDEPGGEAPPDPRPSILGSGGPDAFGYRWTDSDEPGGPTYDWVELGGIGTPVGFPSYRDDGNTGPIPIGFNFSFYGNTFTELYACTNGWLSFTNSTRTTYTNQPLPNSGSTVPENLLAPWWDDMVYDESDGNSAYYYNDGSRFIIQFDIRRIGVFTPPFYKFQVILYPNGQIVYQYHTLGVTTNSCTIGIQNATKDDGLTVVHNDSSYPHEELAILFQSAPDWLSVSPGSGVVPAGECVDLTLAMDACEMPDGDHQAVMTITSNDPANPTVTADVSMHVGEVEADGVQVDPNTLNLGSEGEWINAVMQLPAGYSPDEVLMETVRLRADDWPPSCFPLPPDPAANYVPADRMEVGDFYPEDDPDGMPDLQFKFDRSMVEGMLTEGDQVMLALVGEVEDMTWFMATDYIRVIRPQMNNPNGGETLLSGTFVEVNWANPNGWTVNSASLTYSPDGGSTWSLVAEDIQGESYVWQVPEDPTDSAKLRVYALDDLGVMGYDSSDETFTVTNMVTGAEDVKPTVYALMQNAPNPFTQTTRIVFQLPEESRAEIKVYDVSGRLVRVLERGLLPAGTHDVVWDGKDRGGRGVASGIYFYRLDTGHFTATKRMFLMK